jgi:hypothetical protein
VTLGDAKLPWAAAASIGDAIIDQLIGDRNPSASRQSLLPNKCYDLLSEKVAARHPRDRAACSRQ